jgi:hypothetical protein
MRGSQRDLLLARASLGLRLQISLNFRTKDNTALKKIWLAKYKNYQILPRVPKIGT